MKHDFNILVELANLRNRAENSRFKQKFSNYLPDDLSPWEYCLLLREIWRGGQKASDLATRILFNRTTLPSTLFQLYKTEIKPIPWSALKPLLAPVSADWRRRELVYEGKGLQQDLYALLKCSNRAKICEWPDCNTPYFIAKNRISARYCSEKCRIDALLESKRNWWNKNRKGKR